MLLRPNLGHDHPAQTRPRRVVLAKNPIEKPKDAVEDAANDAALLKVRVVTLVFPPNLPLVLPHLPRIRERIVIILNFAWWVPSSISVCRAVHSRPRKPLHFVRSKDRRMCVGVH